MQAFTTIIPIFLLIGLGWFAGQKGFVPAEFQAPANRLTYYFAIPALIFRATSKASLGNDFHGGVLFATLSAAALAYGTAWLYCRLRRVPPGRCGGVIQTAAHGNLGFIGLPFAYYFLGDAGLVKAGILSGFLMILQNVLSVSALQAFSPVQRDQSRIKQILLKLLSNPVILSSLAGILVSALGISMPLVIQRSIDMLGGLAPPMALLLIGASISFKTMSRHLRAVTVSVFIKLLMLPSIGLLLYQLLGLPPADFLPGLILLCCPTATIAYIFAKEMSGDVDYVVAAISSSTLFSSLSFLLWVTIAMGLPR
ncbi:MAG: AEC family transporter [Desulfuromonadales bacterium]